jgi:hypothetical protein
LDSLKKFQLFLACSLKILEPAGGIEHSIC